MLSRPSVKPLPPICAWNTFVGAVTYFKDNGIPDFVTNKTLPTVSPDVRSRMLTSLRALGLIDEHGRVQERFRRLISERYSGQWEVTLRVLMNSAYPYLSGVDLRQTDSNQLRAAFLHHIGRNTDNLSKCEAFYINMAAAAGVQLSGALQKRVQTAGTMATVKAVRKRESSATATTTSLQKPLRKLAPPPKDLIPTESDAAEIVESEQGAVEKIMDLLRLFSKEGLPSKELEAVLTLLDYAKRKAAVSP